MKYLILIIILIGGLLMANENIVVEEKDGIVITHYSNGETPPKGTVGKLIESYDGCNVTTHYKNGTAMTTCLYCTFQDGATIKTWEKYMISENEFVVIHKSHIYNDPNIGRW